MSCSAPSTLLAPLLRASPCQTPAAGWHGVGDAAGGAGGNRRRGAYTSPGRLQWGLTVKKTGIWTCRLNSLSGPVCWGRPAGQTSKISLRRCAPGRCFCTPISRAPPFPQRWESPWCLWRARRHADVAEGAIVAHNGPRAHLNVTSHQPLLAGSTPPAPSSTRASTFMPLYPTRWVTSTRPARVERRVMRLLRGHRDLARSAAPTPGAGTMSAHAVPAPLTQAQNARRVSRRATNARQCD